ncbi:MAG: 16S rRNA (cytosine(967)-C(5))-methyltransferase RsmB [Terriglobales bacterium]
MPASPARRLAAEVLRLVAETGGYASDLLHSSRAHGMAAADRRLATELVMGVLRWRAQLDCAIAIAARRPVHKIAAVPLAALRLGAYQLRFLDRIPAMAAVHESVELAKADSPRAASFVNAVLRHLPREPVSALLARESDPARRRAIEFSHPGWLLERWGRHFGPEAAAAIAEYNNQPPPVAIRPPLEAAPAGIELAPGRLLASAQRVVGGDISKTAAYLSGQVAIQDEASQLIPSLLEPAAGDFVLDACAAPGAKTAILHALAPAARVIALELHVQRSRLLQRRLRPGAAIVVADATRALPFARRFDRILVDAPCTGTGTLGRNPEIRWRLEPSDPDRLAVLQLQILRRCAAALQPWGRLVYSVCSIEPEEGPGVIASLLAQQPELTVVSAARLLAGLRAEGKLLALPPAAGAYLQILPGAFATDGFFAAILERAR